MLSMEEILKELGCSDGFHIPVANEENKALELEIEKKLKEKRKLASQLEDVNNQVNALLKHQQNLYNEHEQNQKILTAHQSQLQAEQNLLLTVQGEEKRLQQDIRLMDKKHKETNQNIEFLQNEIIKHTKKLEQLKTKVQWDKEALMKWEEEMARGEEDNNMIYNYMREDSHRAKELDLKRLNVKMELDEATHLFNQTVREIEVLEKVLERTAQLYKNSHLERQQTIEQWEGSVKILHQRDKEINGLVEEINMMRVHAKEKMEELEDQKAFYEAQINNNKELELEINQTVQSKSRLQLELKTIQDTNQKLENEIKVVKRSLSTAKDELNYEQIMTKQLTESVTTKNNKISELKKEIKKLKEKQDRLNKHSMSAMDRVHHLEEMVQVEKKTMNLLDVDIKRAQDLLYRTEQELLELKNEEALQTVRMAGCETAKQALSNRANELNKELQRQKEIIYTLDFKAQQLESRIAHLSGNKHKDERELYDRKIAELEEILKGKLATQNLITSQISKQEETMHRLNTALANEGQELQNLKKQLKDLVLLVEREQKELKTRQTKNQELQVEENLLKLRVKQATNAIKAEGNKVYNSERQKLELDLAMKERQVEIDAAKDYLMSQKRRLNEEKSHVLSEIKEYTTKVEQLKNRYDILVSTLGRGDDGEPLSVTYFILQNAQEKHLLQEEGDKLDAKIRQAENEILAMENTLKVVNIANDRYKKSLDVVKEDSPDYKEKEALEHEYSETLEKLKARRNEFKELNNSVKELEGNLEAVNKNYDDLQHELENKQSELQNLGKEMETQQSKIRRADQHLKKLSRDVRSDSSIKSLPVIEKDIETRILKEKNQTALQHLALLTELHPEMGPIVKRYLAEKNLALPSRSACSMLSGRSSRNNLGGSTGSVSKVSDSAERASTVNSVRSQSSSTISPKIVTFDAANFADTASKSSGGSSRSTQTKQPTRSKK